MLLRIVLHTSCYICYLTDKQRDSTIIPELANPAVPQLILSVVHNWREHGATMEDIVDRLRPRTVSHGYVFHTWRAGKRYIISPSCNLTFICDSPTCT